MRECAADGADMREYSVFACLRAAKNKAGEKKPLNALLRGALFKMCTANLAKKYSNKRKREREQEFILRET